jgi:essential nuclear protein 1
MEKIRAKQEEGGMAEGALPGEDGLPVVAPRLDPKVLQVYQGVGKLLTRYTTGKVPKVHTLHNPLSSPIA